MIKQDIPLTTCDYCKNFPAHLLFMVRENALVAKVYHKLVCDEHREELINAKTLKARWSKWI